MIPELTHTQWLLIAVIYLAAIIIARFSVNILRRREWFLSGLLLLVLSAGMGYALNFYKRVHAPEVIAENAREITHQVSRHIDKVGKQVNSNIHKVAGGYTLGNYDVEK